MYILFYVWFLYGSAHYTTIEIYNKAECQAQIVVLTKETHLDNSFFNNKANYYTCITQKEVFKAKFQNKEAYSH